MRRHAVAIFLVGMSPQPVFIQAYDARTYTGRHSSAFSNDGSQQLSSDAISKEVTSSTLHTLHAEACLLDTHLLFKR